ncbi:hypothetical protein RB620_17530 [Paenibacillus sp. LHD-117]|uniref:hypothetical protein n=1 Tax=Paenibacillus sp. LHD-117 TaxID=3071412 RepID=UPI0027E091AA|nr:hypothetical protein [Paenibacillus sp. LHD-117]MDQ6421229.1 hypothetical protein [Paenibacillus sp. LHD-117]
MAWKINAYHEPEEGDASIMRFKTYAICLYLVAVYWISLNIPHMHALFFPTLGAFSLLFISRPFRRDEVRNIAAGAVAASFIGSLLAHWNAGAGSLLITLLIVIGLINLFKWNAPPILAVSLIPYFARPPVFWAIPLSVCGALAGLLLTLSIAAFCEKKFGSFLPFTGAGSHSKTESDSVM